MPELFKNFNLPVPENFLKAQKRESNCSEVLKLRAQRFPDNHYGFDFRFKKSHF
jgi:hypothetical protein